MKNLVAKHMSKTSRPVVHLDRKKAAKKGATRRGVAAMKRSWLDNLI